MVRYIALLRGINVGGNNKIAIQELKAGFEALGFEQVVTHLNSGNVIFSANDEKAKCKINCGKDWKNRQKTITLNVRFSRQ